MILIGSSRGSGGADKTSKEREGDGDDDSEPGPAAAENDNDSPLWGLGNEVSKSLTPQLCFKTAFLNSFVSSQIRSNIAMF